MELPLIAIFRQLAGGTAAGVSSRGPTAPCAVGPGMALRACLEAVAKLLSPLGRGWARGRLAAEFPSPRLSPHRGEGVIKPALGSLTPTLQAPRRRCPDPWLGWDA